MKALSPGKDVGGFTLVELIVGMTLSLMIMGAVLSSYVFLARNFTRSLGTSSGNEPTLESQDRKTLAYFTRDIRMAIGFATTVPTAPDTFENMLLLKIPSSENTSGPNTVLYYYNATSSSLYLHASDVIDGTSDPVAIELPQSSLIRIAMDAPRTSQILHRSLQSCTFSYYDSSGNRYTAFAPADTGFSSLSGVKQIAIALSSQGGKAINGTLTQVYPVASARLVMRNKQFLP